jgi:hypothetical protein
LFPIFGPDLPTLWDRGVPMVIACFQNAQSIVDLAVELDFVEKESAATAAAFDYDQLPMVRANAVATLVEIHDVAAFWRPHP